MGLKVHTGHGKESGIHVRFLPRTQHDSTLNILKTSQTSCLSPLYCTCRPNQILVALFLPGLTCHTQDTVEIKLCLSEFVVSKDPHQEQSLAVTELTQIWFSNNTLIR